MNGIAENYSLHNTSIHPFQCLWYNTRDDDRNVHGLSQAIYNVSVEWNRMRKLALRLRLNGEEPDPELFTGIFRRLLTDPLEELMRWIQQWLTRRMCLSPQTLKIAIWWKLCLYNGWILFSWGSYLFYTPVHKLNPLLRSSWVRETLNKSRILT